jgi:membrane protease YdiL (CAAX protease family)
MPGIPGASLIVFIPTILAVILNRYLADKGQERPALFSRQRWAISLKWLVISLGLALVLRLGVSLLAVQLVPGYGFNPGPFSPFLIMVFLFAAAEEIGWRGFALPTMLANGYQPLTSALILGVPWALLHLPLVLPGMLSEGTPMAAQFVILLALTVITAWLYLSGGGSLTAAVLLHGGQNMTVILNNGLDPVASGWLMAVVYSAVAIAVILPTRGQLGYSAHENN